MQRRLPPLQIKEHYDISKWLFVGLHPATQCTNVHLSRISKGANGNILYRHSGLLRPRVISAWVVLALRTFGQFS